MKASRFQDANILQIKNSQKMDLSLEQNKIYDKKVQKSFKKVTSTKSQYVFKGVQKLKLNDIFDDIRMSQIDKNEQTMFPNNFKQIHRHQLKTYLFEIEIKDAYKTWNIIKRLPQLIRLKQILQHEFPNQLLIFQFPAPEQSEIDHKIAASVLQLFCTFLNSISKSQQICKSKQFLLFIQNWVPTDKRKMTTYLQRNLMKKAGGRHTDSSLMRIMNNFVSWRHKFFTITNEAVYYTDSDQSFAIKQMLLFNQSFSLLHGEIKTGYTYGLILNSSQRILQVDAQNVFNFLLFIYSIRKVTHLSQQAQTNRFNSFAKVSQNCDSTFYIDGKDYFQAVYHQLLKAKKQVFITGWFLTPHMYLLQKYDDLDYRVDKVFEKLAQKGVKVYIIVYNAPRIAIDINPQFTQTYLTSLHQNIKVLRHPNYMFIPFLWSHHEKMVVIDHKVGFMGGFDIGYGRMDDNQHKLADEQQKIWKGIDYCNYRISDLNQIHIHELCSIDRQSQARMPWHDIGIRITGKSVSDLCRHFVQYWNYANYQLYLTESQLMMFTGIHEEELDVANGLQTDIQEQNDKNEHNIIFKGMEREVFIQKNGKIDQDRLNKQTISWKIKEVEQTQKPKDPQLLTPQKNPSNKSFLSVSEDIRKLRKSQLNRSFRKVSNHKKNEKEFKSFFDSMPINNQYCNQQPELKKLRSSEFLVCHENSKQSQIEYYLNYLKKDKNKLTKSFGSFNQQRKRQKKQLQQEEYFPELVLKEHLSSDVNDSSNKVPSAKQIEIKKYSQKHQILRSASLWSLGLKQGRQEKSILQAYLSLIENAKHFIYIENQFFISFQNGVKDKIAERILKAYEKKEIFKVIIVIPFLPGFAGEVDNDSSAVFRVQLDLVYKTICRGQDSLLSMLSQIGNLQDYLGIYCLRNHGKINGMPTTQIVYVHSKLMIIDDSIVLIGSANINDRSLMGDRDSEIAIIVEDSQELQISSQENNVPNVKVKKSAHQLRKKLYMQHFALKQQQAEHFFNFKVWDQIQFNAQRNQKIYRKLFGCYPDDAIKSFSDIKSSLQQAEPQRYEQLKLLIKGYTCPFQTEFLQNQNIQLHSGQKQYYIPFINFT